MRRLALLVTVFAAQAGTAFASSETGTNSYDVFRNGKNIGTHVVHFDKNGDQFSVETKTKMKVKLLFVTAFSYNYTSTEYWEGGEINRVDSVTKNKSGNIVTEAIREGEIYRVVEYAHDTKAVSVVPAPLAPTSHWNMAGLKHAFLFDTITTKNSPVIVTPSASPNQENFTGQRYDIDGEYKYATYYDANGNWQGMAFDRNGFIEFRCRDCVNTLWPDAKPAEAEDAKAQLSSYP